MSSGGLRVEKSWELLVRGVGTALSPDDVDAFRTALVERFVRDNPVYADARRYRRPCRHIPRQVALFSESLANPCVPACGTTGDLFDPGLPETPGMDWHLPRGAESDVRRMLERYAPGVPVEWVERTVRASSGRFCLNAELRDYQSAAVEAALRAGQGVIQAPTGSGKTVIACGLMAATSLNTLFVVHTSVLLEQTVEAVRRFLGVEPGVIGGGRDDIRPVTVAMVQTLARRPLPPLHPLFGMVILDEAHHCPAESFKGIVGGFPAAMRFGLTATPTRKDRLHPVLFDVIGPIVTRVDARNLIVSGSITPVEVVRIDTGFKTRYSKDYGKLVTRIAANRARNELVVQSTATHRGEKTLVLSERVDHCARLAADLNAAGIPSRVLTGSVAREDRKSILDDFAAGRFEVLVSTSSLVGEGFDLPALDTVVVTIPNGNVARTTQLLGRALRPSSGKSAGRIVDFCDFQVPLLANQFNRRLSVYRKFASGEVWEKWPRD